MFFDFLTKIFGSSNDRELKKLMPIVDKINALEGEMKAMDDVPDPKIQRTAGQWRSTG